LFKGLLPGAYGVHVLYREAGGGKVRVSSQTAKVKRGETVELHFALGEERRGSSDRD
jgi:hypothetical protein